MKKTFTWDPETGCATCKIQCHDEIFIGQAKCCDEDRDFLSERTGLNIAELRADIRALKHIKKYIMKPELDSLKQVYHVMTVNKNFNSKSTEARIMRKHIHMKEADLQSINWQIHDTEDFLKEYIRNKDIIHSRIRKKRGSSPAPSDNNN